MLNIHIKSIISENGDLIITLVDKFTISDYQIYDLVWVDEKSNEILVIKGQIDFENSNILKINIFDNIKKNKSYKDSTYYLGIKNKYKDELFKFVIKDSEDNIVTINKKNLNLKSLNIENKNLNLIYDKKFKLEDLWSAKIIFISRFNNRKYILDIDKSCILKDKISINLNEFIRDCTGIKDRWDIFIEYKNNKSISYGKIGLYDEIFNSKYSKHLNYIDTKNTNIVVPFITIKNDIALLVNTYGKYVSEKFKNQVYVKKIEMLNKKFIIRGTLEFKEKLDFKLNGSILELRNSTKEDNRLHYDLDFNYNYVGKNKIDYEIIIDINKYKYKQFYWDIYLLVDINGEVIKIRLKNPNNEVKSTINNKSIKFNIELDNNYILYPYITANNCISIAYRQKGKYETKLYKIKEKLAYEIYILLKPYLEKKEIWLIYEKFSETAQDNSFYFFKYCYENYPDKNIYYIITKDSKDYKNIEKYKDRVIHFMSIKHLVYLCAAKLLISSESKGHSYAWRVQTGNIKQELNTKKMVFLQHGVTALKRVDGVFKKTSANAVDLIVATSEYEKNIIKKYFNYNEDEIIVTGFARWDVLKDKSKDLDKKEIFFMPTWRNWLDEVPEDEFEKSRYFINYMEILNSKKLSNILGNDVIINYFVHPKFKYYIEKFSTNSKNIRIVQPGEIQVNELLMRASLLITDYSSVAWEMYYQNKPTIFYHFDIDDYNKHQGSYLDMEKELFGDVAMNSKELISKIEKYISTDFKHPSKFVEMRKKYFSNIDNKNCDRIYNEIYKNRSKLYKTLYIRQQLLKYLRKKVLVKKIWKSIKEIPQLGEKIYNYKEKIFYKYKIEYKNMIIE